MTPDEINTTEMSTLRMKDEPFVTIFASGPRGGTRGMLRLDLSEAAKLAEALSRAVREAQKGQQ